MSGYTACVHLTDSLLQVLSYIDWVLGSRILHVKNQPVGSLLWLYLVEYDDLI
jgi:hypothetical protein